MIVFGLNEIQSESFLNGLSLHSVIYIIDTATALSKVNTKKCVSQCFFFFFSCFHYNYITLYYIAVCPFVSNDMTLYFIEVVLIMSRLNFESTFHRSNSKYLILSTLHYLLITPRSFNLYMHIVMKHLYHTRVECICQLKIVIILFFVSNEINVWRNRELTFSRSVFFISCFGLHTVYSLIFVVE